MKITNGNILLITVLLLCPAQVLRAAYNYIRPITIDHTQVGTVGNTDQSNFPVAFAGTFTFLKTTANGGYVTSSSGFDIVFTSDSGCASIVNFERVSWSGTTGASEFHVLIATVSHTTDTVFYLCYGNSAVITDQQNATGTWDTNFKAVIHFSSASYSPTDSTSNGNSPSTNSASPPTAVSSAVIGGGANYSGTQYSSMNSPTGFASGTSQRTTEAWVNMTGAGGANQDIVAYGNNTNDQRWAMYWDTTNKMQVDVQGFGARTPFTPDSQWHHIAIVFPTSSTNVNQSLIYIDGTSRTVTSDSSTINTATTAFALGTNSGSLNGNDYTGKLDEVRISATARSADWIITEYNNQRPTSNFLTIGANLASAPVATGYHKVRTITIDHTKVVSADQTNFTVLFSTRYHNALNGAINNSVTSITVSTGFGNNVQNNDYIKFDSEIMLVTAGGGSTSLTVNRAQKSTSAASHSNNADGTNMFLANSANGNGDVTSSSGFDIIFSSSSTCTSNHTFERSIYSATTGVAEFWYGPIATLSHTVDTVFYICYSNSSISTDQQNAADSWDGNYQTIYHFGDGTTLSLTDSTFNANSGTNSGTAAGTGLMGGGVATGATTNFITSAGFPLLNVPRSIDMWVNGAVPASNAYIYGYGPGTTNNRYIVDILAVNGFGFDCFGSSFTGSGSASDSTWHHLVSEFSGSTVAFYLDGNAAGSASCSVNTLSTSEFINTTAQSFGGWNASFDEFRVSNKARGVAASCSLTLGTACGPYATEHNTGLSDGTFYKTSAATSINSIRHKVVNQ